MISSMAAIATELPVTEPVLIVAIAFAIFLVAPAIAERLRVPGMVGLILAGAVVGPNGLNLLDRDPTIVLLGTVGLLYLMFLAGAEIDLHGFRRYRNRSLVFGALTFLLPQSIGTGVGLLLGYPLPAAVLLASLFASHTLVAYPMTRRFGISKTQAVTTAVGGTIITDTAALLVLAVVAASVEGALGPAFWIRLTIGLALYVALILLVLPRIGRWLFRHERAGATAEFLFLLAALFAGSFLAEVAGVEAIVGAFLVGLSLNRLIPEHGPLASRVHFVGDAVFIPFFLLSIGMLVDGRVLLGGSRVWEVMVAMTVVVVVTKALAAKLAQRIFGYTPEEGWTIFGLTVPQAAATLAATLIGYEIGLFDDAVLNGAILMILVTVVIGPWMVGRYGRMMALREERKPYEPAEAPQRVLVPLANPATVDTLMDLALAVRDTDSTEPVFPLTVVPPDNEPGGARVAEAEKMLGHAVAFGAAADVPVVPMIRVDHNIASGIGRGITERRASTVVIGWDARAPRIRGIFGTVLDQLLAATKEQVLVARLGHPLNTTSRLIVVVPRGANHMPGFYDTIRSTKLLANRLGVPIEGLVVGASPRRYQPVFTEVKPDAPVTFERVPGWSDLTDELTRRLQPDDLVVVFGAREGALAWHPALNGLPARLAETVAGSFIVAYSSEAEPLAAARGRIALPGNLLPPRRVVRDLPAEPLPAVLRRILSTELGSRPRRLEEIAKSLLRHRDQLSSELAPGVFLLHGHFRQLRSSMVFLGTSRDGIRLAPDARPAHAIFILLSPEEPAEEHLSNLAALVRFVNDRDQLRSLLEAAAPAPLRSPHR